MQIHRKALISTADVDFLLCSVESLIRFCYRPISGSDQDEQWMPNETANSQGDNQHVATNFDGGGRDFGARQPICDRSDAGINRPDPADDP